MLYLLKTKRGSKFLTYYIHPSQTFLNRLITNSIMSESESQTSGLEDSIENVEEREKEKEVLVKSLGILLGKGDEESRNVPRFDIIKKSIKLLEGRVKNYRKCEVPKDQNFAVTYIHPETRKDLDINNSNCNTENNSIFDCHEMATDILRYFLSDSFYFQGVQITESHTALAERIEALYRNLEDIRNTIFSKHSALHKMESTGRTVSLSTEFQQYQLIARQIYIREEFEMRQKVIPLIDEMIFIYKEGKRLVEYTIENLTTP